jgi:hypothetical protein
MTDSDWLTEYYEENLRIDLMHERAEEQWQDYLDQLLDPMQTDVDDFLIMLESDDLQRLAYGPPPHPIEIMLRRWRRHKEFNIATAIIEHIIMKRSDIPESVLKLVYIEFGETRDKWADRLQRTIRQSDSEQIVEYASVILLSIVDKSTIPTTPTSVSSIIS